MSDISTNNNESLRILTELRKAESQAKGGVIPANGHGGNVSFSELLSNAVNHVNTIQNNAAVTKNSYEMGDSSVTLAKVMVEAEKANISFQGLIEVRKKLLNAYREVMNMSV